jgi:hypothetical protein
MQYFVWDRWGLWYDVVAVGRNGDREVVGTYKTRAEAAMAARVLRRTSK